MSRWIWLLTVVAALVAALAPRASRASERVVLVRPQGPAYLERSWPLVEERLRAELGAAGMEVTPVEIELTADDDLVDALARQAAEVDALAAVCVVRSGSGGVTRIWIDDQVTGKVVMSRFASDSESEAKEAGEVALRIVELLHASLIELRLMEIEGREPPKQVDAVSRLVEEKLEVDEPWMSLLVGASALVSVQSLDPMLGLWLGAKARLPYQLRLEVEVGATPLRAEVSGRGGAADVGLAIGRGHLSLEAPWDWPLVPSIGVGAAFVLLWADGRADEGFVASTSLANGTALSLRISAALELADWLVGHVVVGSMFVFPELAVRFADQVVARTGRPILDFGVVLEWR